LVTDCALKLAIPKIFLNFAKKMFLRLLTAAILCLAVRGDEEELMPTGTGFLSYLIEHKMPTEFSTSCPPAASDILFALDGSASISEPFFIAGKNLIRNGAKQLDDLGLLGSGPEQSRIGAFQFGKGNYEMFPFEDSLDKVSAALDEGFFQNASSSRIADAVDWALVEAAYFGGGERPLVKKVLVLLTDCLDTCDNAKEVSTKTKADQAGLSLWLVTYTPDVLQSCVQALTGSDTSRHYISASVDDMAKFTGCPPIIENATCYNNGNASCVCPPGFTGKHCETAIDCCTRRVLQGGKNIDVPLCSTHGHCIHDEKTGCRCNCTEFGWFGPQCDQYPDDRLSKRCVAYPYPDPSAVSDADKAKVVPEGYRCDIGTERCIADNINCHFNMPSTKDSNGKAVCSDPAKTCDGKDDMCKCKNPIGWCVPLEFYNNVVGEATKAMKFVQKYRVLLTTPSS
jgi:hypothetical protein